MVFTVKLGEYETHLAERLIAAFEANLPHLRRPGRSGYAWEHNQQLARIADALAGVTVSCRATTDSEGEFEEATPSPIAAALMAIAETLKRER